MTGHATYLFIDLATVLVPLIASFHPRIAFVKTWRAFWPACLAVAALFILWDSVFTRMGVWGFNERYVSDMSVAGLPIEELLFFICIPYACVFTYFAVGSLIARDRWSSVVQWTVVGGSAALVALAIANTHRWYTASTFILLAVLLFWLALKMKPKWLTRALLSYIIVLPLFFVVNGLLTGSWIEEPVVWYDDDENLGLRIGTIPVEDIFYGLLLVLLNITVYEHLRRSAHRTDQ